MQHNPWVKITHDFVLNQVEKAIGQSLTNLIIQRNSYINRVFELELAETKERIIVKFYRPNRWTLPMIQTEHDLLQQLAAEELRVIQPFQYHNQSLFKTDDIPFAVFPKMGGRALDELAKEDWEQVGRLIGRLHTISRKVEKPDRIIWQPKIATKTHLEGLKNAAVIPADYQNVFFQSVDRFIEKYTPSFDEQSLILCHGDCHLGNFIHRPGEGIYLIDFDDMCIGPVSQELWMLLPDTSDHCENEISWFISGYNTFGSFPEKSLTLIPALRVMRVIHFASWCALQVNEPGFKQHFPEWGSIRYWNEVVKSIQEIL